LLPGLNTFTYFSILVFSFPGESKSQGYSNSFYFEGLGNGIYFSINYERIIEKKYNFRIGISSLPTEEFESVSSLIIPITFSCFIGESDLKFEFDEKGIFLKTAYTPFIFKGKYNNWLGGGIGYKF
jgi:hypothetical protein